MKEPLILHLESATERCSVGLSKADKLLALRESQEPFQHASRINGLIQESLEAGGIQLCDLNAVSVSSGPGSYTALRVGASTAKGLCYGLNIPLIPIPTLYALAFRMSQEPELKSSDILAPMLDARREDVYVSLFDRNLKLVGKTIMCTLSDTLFSDFPESEIWVAGSGSAKAKELLGRNVRVLDLDHSARLLVEPAFRRWQSEEFVEAASFRPDYITAPNITQPKKAL